MPSSSAVFVCDHDEAEPPIVVPTNSHNKGKTSDIVFTSHPHQRLKHAIQRTGETQTLVGGDKTNTRLIRIDNRLVMDRRIHVSQVAASIMACFVGKAALQH